MTDPSETPDLQAEVAALRARNAELEQERSASTASRIKRAARSTGSALLIIVGVLCLVVAPAAIWGRNLVLNNDRYVETLTPLAKDPGVQNAVIQVVDRQVEDNLDVRSLLGEVLSPRAAAVLAVPLQSAAQGLVNTITTKFVRSDAFQTLWVNVNRVAHQQLVYALTGTQPANSAVRIRNGQIVLDLSTVVDTVKSQLVSAGLTIASKVPTVGATIEIADAQGLIQARKTTRLLNTAADWLPWIGLVLTAGGIAAARKRRRALIASALGVAGGMIVIGIALFVGRHIYLDSIPPDQLPRDTAAFIFETLVRFLREGIRLVALIMLLIGLGAWLSGPSRSAVATRARLTAGPRALGHRLELRRAGRFVRQYALALRVGIIALAGIVLLLMTAPSLADIIVLAVIALVLLLIVEVLRAAGGSPA
jgi:hypothetical protein